MEGEVLTDGLKKEALDQEQGQGQEGVIFESDKEYLDAYCEIQALLLEHYYLAQDIKDYRPRRDRRPHRGEEIESDRKKVPELNKTIQFKEWLFWEKVARSRDCGRNFLIEEIAAYYKLSHFEKRVFLFFLCNELSGENGTSFSASSLITILDLEKSVIVKIKNLAYFEKKALLLKQGILAEECIYEPREFKLNKIFMQFLSKRLNGESVDWPKYEKKNKDADGIERVGFTRAPEQSLESVVLKDEIKEKVRFFLEIYKSNAFQELDVDKAIKNSRGLTFLFYGPPGTGKSMLAESIAQEVGKKLLVAEVPKIMSMWLGETDKNIQAMFKSAKENDLVLLIDEADSLIYSREMASSDYKVRFVNVMLTELERFEGIAILTTNMDKILDNALERRIALKVQFELPVLEKRAQIWRNHIPSRFSLASDVNIDELARRYEFAGGNIKNAVLNAVRRVIFRKEKVLTMEDLVFGGKIEEEGMLSLKKHPKIGFKV